MEEGKHRESVIDACFFDSLKLRTLQILSKDLATMMPGVSINMPSFESLRKRGLFRGITMHTGVGSRCLFWQDGQVLRPQRVEQAATGLHASFMCMRQSFAHARILLIIMYHV